LQTKTFHAQNVETPGPGRKAGDLSRNVSQILTVELAELVGRVSSSSIDAIRNGLQLLFERAR
jgi:hypothetical protein